MAVKVKVIEGNGRFAGPSSNVSGFTVQESSTPTIPGDTTGGVGSLSFGAVGGPKSKLLSGNYVELVDDERGTMRAFVSGFSNNDSILSIDTNNRLALLTVERSGEPFHGTLAELFEYYFGLCGITDNYVIDPTFHGVYLAMPSFTGDVWTFLKSVCVPYDAEITLVSGVIHVRPIRNIMAQNAHDASVTEDTSIEGLAQSVEVYYYNNEWIEEGVVYAPGTNTATYQVEANEYLEETVDTSTHMIAVQQPFAITEAAWHSNPSGGGYVVYNEAGAMVDPAEWSAKGGFISATIDPEDDTRLLLVIKGMNGLGAPFRIMTPLPGDNQSQSSLRITGTGTRFNKKLVTVQTGADERYVTDNKAVTVDSPVISTLAQAYDAAARLAATVAGPQQTITIKTTGINRRGELNTGRYLTMNEFNMEYSGYTMDQFNTEWSGKTFQDFNDYYAGIFATDFETQAYGNIAGARVRIGDTMYRIRTATLTPGGIDYTAERDTMMEDFNAVWSGATMDDFNAAFEGMTMDEFNVMSLHR